MTLQDILDDPALRARFIADGAKLVDAEVARKPRLSGVAIRAGFAAIRTVKPDIVPSALELLLPAFAPAVEPYFQAGQQQGDVAAHFAANAGPIAEALLRVTDQKADKANNALVKRTYHGLRGSAHAHTAEAIPAVGQLLAGYLR